MTLTDDLKAYPDLAVEVAPDATRFCRELTTSSGYGRWPCMRVPRWQVDGKLQCTQHAAVSLRRVLLGGDGSDQ